MTMKSFQKLSCRVAETCLLLSRREYLSGSIEQERVLKWSNSSLFHQNEKFQRMTLRKDYSFQVKSMTLGNKSLTLDLYWSNFSTALTLNNSMINYGMNDMI